MSDWLRFWSVRSTPWTRRLSAGLSLAAVLIMPVRAQDQAQVTGIEAAAQQNLDWINEMVVHVLARLAPLAPVEHRAKLRAAQVLVGPTGDYFAGYDPRTDKITIQYGTWSSIGRVADMVLDIQDDPSRTAKVSPYIEYLATVRADAIQVILGKGSKRFAQFAGFGGADWQGPPGNSSRNADYLALYTDAAAFLLAHEFQHKLLGHRSPSELTPEQARQQELDADLAAFDWVHKAGFSMAGVVVYLYLPVALQVDKQQLVRTRNHMHPVCRQGLAMVASTIDYLAYKQHNPSTAAQSAEFVEQFKALDAAFRRESGGHSLDDFLSASLNACDPSVKPLVKRLQGQAYVLSQPGVSLSR